VNFHSILFPISGELDLTAVHHPSLERDVFLRYAERGITAYTYTRARVSVDRMARAILPLIRWKISIPMRKRGLKIATRSTIWACTSMIECDYRSARRWHGFVRVIRPFYDEEIASTRWAMNIYQRRGDLARVSWHWFEPTLQVRSIVYGIITGSQVIGVITSSLRIIRVYVTE